MHSSSFTSQYEVCDTLGKGAFSTVKLVKPKTISSSRSKSSLPSSKTTSPLTQHIKLPSPHHNHISQYQPPAAAATKSETTFFQQRQQQQAAAAALGTNTQQEVPDLYAAKIFLPQYQSVNNNSFAAAAASSCNRTTPNISPQRSYNNYASNNGAQHQSGGGGVSPARLFGMADLTFSKSNVSDDGTQNRNQQQQFNKTASASSTPTTPRNQVIGVPGCDNMTENHNQSSSAEYYNADDKQNNRNIAFDQASAEARLLSNCPIHPNLLHLRDSFLDETIEEHPVLVTDLAPGRELFQILSERQRRRNQIAAPFSEAEVRDIMSQLFSAIAALHQNDIVHRDCKLENVLWDIINNSVDDDDDHEHEGKRGKLTLVDFGMAVQLKYPAERLTTLCAGSPHYVSPEMLKTAKYANSSANSSQATTPIQGPTKINNPSSEMSPSASTKSMPQLPFSIAAGKPTAASVKTYTSPPSAAATGEASSPSPSRNLNSENSGGAAAVRNNSLSNFHLSPAAAAPGTPTQNNNNSNSKSLSQSVVSASSPNQQQPQLLLPSRNLNSVTNYGKEIDIWACGVIMYVLLEGQYPFHNEKSKLAWHRSVFEGAYRPTQVASEGARNLIAKLLQVDPKKRISATEALREEFFFTAEPTTITSRNLRSGGSERRPMERGEVEEGGAAHHHHAEDVQLGDNSPLTSSRTATSAA